MEGNRVKLPNKSARHALFGSVPSGPKKKPVAKEKMQDLQNQHGAYLFPIQSVGVSNVKYPVHVRSSLEPADQQALAVFQLTSSLPSSVKGTNMSRFMEELEEARVKGELAADFDSLTALGQRLIERLDQQDVQIRMEFPWMFHRTGPAAELGGINHAEAAMDISFSEMSMTRKASMTCAVTTLCPCSKEISEYSAHNQRGYITMDVEFNERFSSTLDWKAELLEAAETNASAFIHPVLKRTDEKMVTEKAYENPRFVEDIVRLVAADLYELDYIDSFCVKCRNEESIHLHDAYAEVTIDKTAN